MNLRARYGALPRAGRWSVWALAGIVVYFAGVEPALALWSRIGGEADSLEASLKARAATAQRLEATGGELERAMVSLGAPAMPAKADPLPALDRRIASVLAAHGVTARKREPRKPEALTTGPSGRDPAFVGDQTSLLRVGVEVTLECDTEQLSKILHDLEASAEVASVSRLSIRKAGDGKPGDQKLGVVLTVEAWSVATGDREGVGS